MYKIARIVSVQYDEFNSCVTNTLRYRKLLSPSKTPLCPSQSIPKLCPKVTKVPMCSGVVRFCLLLNFTGMGPHSSVVGFFH